MSRETAVLSQAFHRSTQRHMRFSLSLYSGVSCANNIIWRM